MAKNLILSGGPIEVAPIITENKFISYRKNYERDDNNYTIHRYSDREYETKGQYSGITGSGLYCLANTAPYYDGRYELTGEYSQYGDPKAIRYSINENSAFTYDYTLYPQEDGTYLVGGDYYNVARYCLEREYKWRSTMYDVVPGVKYNRDAKQVLYNGQFPKIVLGEYGEWTWDEFGMTEKLFNKYKDEIQSGRGLDGIGYNIIFTGNTDYPVSQVRHAFPTFMETDYAYNKNLAKATNDSVNFGFNYDFDGGDGLCLSIDNIDRKVSFSYVSSPK